MNPAGWCIMIAAVGGITSLFTWCIWRVLRAPQDHLEVPFGEVAPDAEQA